MPVRLRLVGALKPDSNAWVSTEVDVCDAGSVAPLRSTPPDALGVISTYLAPIGFLTRIRAVAPAVSCCVTREHLQLDVGQAVVVGDVRYLADAPPGDLDGREDPEVLDVLELRVDVVVGQQRHAARRDGGEVHERKSQHTRDRSRDQDRGPGGLCG